MAACSGPGSVASAGDWLPIAPDDHLRAPSRKGATGAQCAAGRLQEKSEGVLADGIFDE